MTAQEHIERRRGELLDSEAPRPLGNPADLQLQLENVTSILAAGLAHAAAHAPQQQMVWNGDLGRLLPYGLAPQIPDPLDDPALRALVTWAAWLSIVIEEDAAAHRAGRARAVRGAAGRAGA